MATQWISISFSNHLVVKILVWCGTQLTLHFCEMHIIFGIVSNIIVVRHLVDASVDCGRGRLSQYVIFFEKITTSTLDDCSKTFVYKFRPCRKVGIVGV